MPTILCIRDNWNDTALDIPIPGSFFNVDIRPTIEYPFGEKGRVLANAWRQLSKDDYTGMLILNGDVIIEPTDHKNMLAAIHTRSDQVVIAPTRIWPKSTKRKDWIWGHWSFEGSQKFETKNVRWFTFCFTYIPRKVIDQALKDGLVEWRYPGVDMNMARSAVKAKVPVYVAENVLPKHLNF